MTSGTLKTSAILVNKIANGICDTVSLSQTTKHFSNYYNEEGFYEIIQGTNEQCKKQNLSWRLRFVRWL